MSLNIPDNLRTEVQALERDAAAASTAASKAAQSKEQADAAIQTHRKTMGFWDRNFWGIFGDKEKVGEHKKLKSLSAEFNKRAAAASAKKNNIEASIDGKIESYLSGNDAVYKLLQAPYNAAGNFRRTTREFISIIDDAINAVSRAQMTETNDMRSDSEYFAQASHLDNMRARDAIQRVRGSMPIFQRAAANFSAEMKNLKDHSIDLNGSEDIIDLSFDTSHTDVTFDFSSMLVLGALGRARSGLESLRNDILRADQRAATCMAQTQKAAENYKKKVRSACSLKP